MRAGLEGDTPMVMRILAAGVMAFALVWGADRLAGRIGWLPVALGLAVLTGSLLLKTLRSRRCQRRFLAALRGAILDTPAAPTPARETLPALAGENDR